MYFVYNFYINNGRDCHILESAVQPLLAVDNALE